MIFYLFVLWLESDQFCQKLNLSVKMDRNFNDLNY
jgi:hypothetical protein